MAYVTQYWITLMDDQPVHSVLYSTEEILFGVDLTPTPCNESYMLIF